MAVETVVKTIGSTGTFSTLQLWEDGQPGDLTTAERSACGTFLVAAFVQGENLTFVGSGATGKLLDTDSTGAGTGTYMTYGITAGNPAASDVITGGTSTATCILTSGTPDFTGVIWQGKCQNQEFSGTGTQLTIGGTTNSATAYAELTTVAGASFRDNASVQSNALAYNASNGCGIRGTSASTITVSQGTQFGRISNLQIAATGSSSTALYDSGTTSGVGLNNLILEGTYAGTNSSEGVLVFSGTSACSNSLIIQRASAADHIVASNFLATPKLYNCTIVAPDDLATAPTQIFKGGAASTTTVQNCQIYAGDSTKAIKSGGTHNFTTCYSDISGTSGVTQTTYANEFQNVNDSTRDYRLVTGAAGKDTGTTDATNAAIDIAGTSRPQGSAYDVGCWEFVAGRTTKNTRAWPLGTEIGMGWRMNQ